VGPGQHDKMHNRGFSSSVNPLQSHGGVQLEVAPEAVAGSPRERRSSEATYNAKKSHLETYVKMLKCTNFTVLFLTLCMIGVGSYLISSVGQFSASLQTILATLLLSTLFNLIGIAISIWGQVRFLVSLYSLVLSFTSSSSSSSTIFFFTQNFVLLLFFVFFLFFFCFVLFTMLLFIFIHANLNHPRNPSSTFFHRRSSLFLPHSPMQTTVAHDVALEHRTGVTNQREGGGGKKSDMDGRNTPGQMKILFGFYCGFICSANIVVCGLALAINGGSADTLKNSVLSSGSKMMSGDIVGAMYPLLIALVFLYMIINAIGMFAASKIVTSYTVLQSFLQVLCILYSCMSLFMIFGAVYALCMNQFAGPNDLQVAPALIFSVVWGFLMFFVCIFGIVATKWESAKGLKVFAGCLLFMTVLLFVGIGLGSNDVNKTIDTKCSSVITVMSDRGWHQLFSCNK